MTFTSYTTPDGKSEPMPLEEFISKALIPAYEGALTPFEIVPNHHLYAEFVRNGIYSRHICKASCQDNIPRDLPLILKIKVDDKPVHALKIIKKGDALISIHFMDIVYDMGSNEINKCDSYPMRCDGEVILSDHLERSLNYYTPGFAKSEPESKELEPLDKILADIRSINC